jgi:hypothetical protein
MSHDASWWYSSTSAADPTPAQWRTAFNYRVQNLVANAPDEETKRAFQWYADFVITPLMTSYDLDDPFLVEAEPLLAPEG